MFDKCSWDQNSQTAIICKCKNVDVAEALANLPVTVMNLTFQLESDLAGQLNVPPIDLYNISHLTNLEYLALTHGYKQSINCLMFSPETFENLTKLRELHLNIITKNDDIGNITRFSEGLKVLDLTYTMNLNLLIVQNMLRSSRLSTLNILSLKSFQMPGVSGFSDALNISKSFNKSFSLQHLDLSRNMLGVIYPSIITMFPNLTFLDISHNTLVSHYNNPFLFEMLMHPSLEIVNFGNQGQDYISHSSEMKNSYYSRLQQKTPSQQHTATQYAFWCINSNTNENISFLFMNSSVFCSVVRCFLGQHLLYWQDISCDVYGKIEDYIDFSCPYFIKLPVLKRLKTLTGAFLNWINVPSQMTPFEFCFDTLLLQYINFSNNKNWIHNSLFFDLLQKPSLSAIFNKVKIFDLSHNNLMSFPSGRLPKLEILNVASNNIHILNKSLCDMYPNLRNVSIAQNKLSYLFPDFFRGCKYLEHIDLSGNLFNLSEYPINIDNNHMLRTVNLNSNNIDILPPNLTKQLDEIAKNKIGLEVKISNNNLLCMCTHETLEFIDWFKNTRVVIPEKDQITCSSLQGIKLLNTIVTDDFKSTCFPSNIMVIVYTIVGMTCVIIIVMFSAAIYRYRWRIQFNMIKTSNTLCCKNRESPLDNVKNNRMKYDAFVSYCSADRFWVHDCLMKTLESDLYGFKLCIHYRDFPLGEDISTVIVNSIRKSRQLIIVLSNCSITRPWCQLEFQVALSEAMRRGIKLVVIKLGTFTVDNTMDSSLAWVLDNHTYLEWKESSDAQKVFWFKLIQHLSGSIAEHCCFGSAIVGSDEVSAFSDSEAESKPLLI